MKKIYDKNGNPREVEEALLSCFVGKGYFLEDPTTQTGAIEALPKENLSKAELVALCEQYALETTGNKSELLERVTAYEETLLDTEENTTQENE